MIEPVNKGSVTSEEQIEGFTVSGEVDKLWHWGLVPFHRVLEVEKVESHSVHHSMLHLLKVTGEADD